MEKGSQGVLYGIGWEMGLEEKAQVGESNLHRERGVFFFFFFLARMLNPLLVFVVVNL